MYIYIYIHVGIWVYGYMDIWASNSKWDIWTQAYLGPGQFGPRTEDLPGTQGPRTWDPGTRTQGLIRWPGIRNPGTLDPGPSDARDPRMMYHAGNGQIILAASMVWADGKDLPKQRCTEIATDHIGPMDPNGSRPKWVPGPVHHLLGWFRTSTCQRIDCSGCLLSRLFQHRFCAHIYIYIYMFIYIYVYIL